MHDTIEAVINGYMYINDNHKDNERKKPKRRPPRRIMTLERCLLALILALFFAGRSGVEIKISACGRQHVEAANKKSATPRTRM
ncbi:MAG: hypothetical protein LBO78_02055 [Rickettsiales bacterium]|jgi:hypothetical protein|nr:hypothetical protein [Rickettsiales bacterium]